MTIRFQFVASNTQRFSDASMEVKEVVAWILWCIDLYLWHWHWSIVSNLYQRCSYEVDHFGHQCPRGGCGLTEGWFSYVSSLGDCGLATGVRCSSLKIELAWFCRLIILIQHGDAMRHTCCGCEKHDSLWFCRTWWQLCMTYALMLSLMMVVIQTFVFGNPSKVCSLKALMF